MSRMADKMIEIQEAISAQGSVVDFDAVARECGVPVQWVEDEYKFMLDESWSCGYEPDYEYYGA